MTDEDPIVDLGLFSPAQALRRVRNARRKTIFLGFEMPLETARPAEGDARWVWPKHISLKVTKPQALKVLAECAESDEARLKAGKEALLIRLRQSERCLWIR